MATLETPLFSLMDIGNLTIGIGTILLGIGVLRATWVIANRDRKVHIADKQQDWLREFRHKIAELMALQMAMATISSTATSVSGEKALLEHRTGRLNQLVKLEHLSNNLLFMFDTRDGHYDDIKVAVEACNSVLGTVNIMTAAKMATQHSDLRKLIDKIINQQRKRIVSLDIKSPLI